MIFMAFACLRMSFVCSLMSFKCTRTSLVYTYMSSVCHLYITRMWFYREPNKIQADQKKFFNSFSRIVTRQK